jgi:hypothetical protein
MTVIAHEGDNVHLIAVRSGLVPPSMGILFSSRQKLGCPQRVRA